MQNQKASIYNSIYTKLEELLNVKVEQGNSLSSSLNIIGWILTAFIVIIIIAAMVLSTKIGQKIAKNIAEPLIKLG